MTRTDVIMSAVLRELEARRAHFDAPDAAGEVKLVVKFRQPNAPADTLTLRFAFSPESA